jgi:hypothetical protein
MKLTELIEHCHLDLAQLNRDVINREILANYSDSEIVDLTRAWLRGIGNQHQVPGDLVWRMSDIAAQWSETHRITQSQLIFLIQNCLEQWHQIQLESRVEMGL